MKADRKNSVFVWKRAATRVLAAFLVLYALSDVTVLQAYCGNELTGIPPASLVVRTTEATVFQNSTSSASAKSSFNYQSDNDHSSRTAAAHDCFCYCSHVLIENISLELPTISEAQKTARATSVQADYRSSTLTYLFRPPRFA